MQGNNASPGAKSLRVKCGAESGKSKVEAALVKAARTTEPTSGSQNYSPFHTGGENQYGSGDESEEAGRRGKWARLSA